MKQLHIVTVGTSLISNYAKAKGCGVGDALRRGQDVAAFLQQDPRAASAEINALDARTGFLARTPESIGATLVFSETAEGALAARTIAGFLRKRRVAVSLVKMKSLDLPGNSRADPATARQKAEAGLRELRQRLIEHVVRMNKQHPGLAVEFNVTGGFKAEAAVLYDASRFLRAPAYYLHETFRTVVVLP